MVLSVPRFAAAQLVTDPQTVQFTASPDHFATDANGQPLVDHYNLAVYPSGSTTPFEVMSLGKPSPAGDGTIQVSLGSVLTTPLLPQTTYAAQVVAIGPSGSAASDWSNPFSVSGGCTYSASINAQSFVAAGGTGTVTVTTGNGCAWTAGTEAGWATTGAASGTGTGTVSFTVAPNTSSTSRTTNVDVATKSFAITQTGVSCTFALAAAGQSIGAAGGAASVGVTAPDGCAWSSTSNASWIVAGAAGSGSSSASFTVAANTTTSSRTGTITIAGNTYAVTQAAGTLPCTYSGSVSSTSFPAAGGTGQFSVTAANGCAWTVTINAPWLSVTSGGGTGTGSVAFTVQPNTSSVSRTATVNVATSTFSITQAGAACTFSLSPSTQSFGAAGGSGSVGVTAPAGCGWSAFSTAVWIATGATGTGTGTAAFTVAANTTTSSRTGTITLGGSVVTITQNAAQQCTFSLGAPSQFIAGTGGTGSVVVTTATGCAWTQSSNASWITAGSGATGSAAASFTVDPNPSLSTRTGTLTIAGITYSVTQGGAVCIYTLSATSQSFPAAGGTGSVDVTTPGGCSWSTFSSLPWVKMTTTATTGPASAAFTVAPNTSTSGRTGIITIAGKSFTVTQAPAASTTVTSAAFSLPGPTSAACGLSPTVTLSPQDTWVIAGSKETLYKVSIQNVDTAGCPASTFGLQVALPTAWSGKFDSAILSSSPGSTVRTNLHVTAASTTGPGAYPVVVTATNATTGLVCAGSATENIVTLLTVTPSVAIVGNSHSAKIAVTTTVMAGSSVVNDADVTIAIKRADGSLVGTWTDHTGGNGVSKTTVDLGEITPGTYTVLIIAMEDSAAGKGTATFTLR